MKTTTEEIHILPTWSFPLLINGEIDTLDLLELDKINQWEKRILSRCDHYSIDSSGDKYFAIGNDIYPNGAVVVDCKVTLFH